MTREFAPKVGELCVSCYCQHFFTNLLITEPCLLSYTGNKCPLLDEYALNPSRAMVAVLERRDKVRKEGVVGSGVVIVGTVGGVEAGSCIPGRDWTKFCSWFVSTSLLLFVGLGIVNCRCLSMSSLLLRDESAVVALLSIPRVAVCTALAAALDAEEGVSCCCCIPPAPAG